MTSCFLISESLCFLLIVTNLEPNLKNRYKYNPSFCELNAVITMKRKGILGRLYSKQVVFIQ